MKKVYPMAVVTVPGKVEFKERTITQLSDHDVLIRVRAAAICGSDLHVFNGRHPSVPLPSAIGHELSGVVERVGKGVSLFQEGDRVVVEPVIVCGTCEFCLSGRYNLCTQISFQYRQGQGAFTPYFVAEERWVHHLPESISFEEGALVEPLAVAVHAVGKAGIKLGWTSTIFGDGAIGLLILMLIKRSGGGETLVVGAQEHRLAKAMELGASEVFDNCEGDAVSAIMERTYGAGTDLSFEAVGQEQTLLQSLMVLRKGGTAVLLGIFEEPEVRITPNLFIQKEISLVGSQGYCWDFQTALKLMGQGAVRPGEIITHVLPLESLQDGFQLLMDKASQAIKVVIKVA
jgi:2-desacetyl-2-hydroxyethyl bacteriochlorophyllide A dehydrogenase